ncbi:YMGG-like glycine zipper-containing protein [Hoeflea prorocentri]|uniref:YMGG-like glycine zipper-containing protein n=1 Tax=Hoeflea prorocentri TaxID=1922333 RepID=A0A9X3ULU2_9HYPH|nr:YMGG-like glycine zipper-containing protein [Hoeflea prorocentri]MCY6383613.1 YMGG-like glycine zipper-containing protein [Hoeflea prorocentri]MDA5401413.1 YMGG-like glycine zipper-containing protein [Hoeflea prorocentri]
MKNILALAVVGLAIAGCTPTQQGATIGAASGAAIGAVATGTAEGALVGAAIGGVAGAVIGRVSEGSDDCFYRDRYGRRYTARCPQGY